MKAITTKGGQDLDTNISPEQCQTKLDKQVNDVLSLLIGETAAQAKTILEAAIYRLAAHSYVQSHSLPQ